MFPTFDAHLLRATPRFSTENNSEWCKLAEEAWLLEGGSDQRVLVEASTGQTLDL